VPTVVRGIAETRRTATYNHTGITNMAKMRTGALRRLHGELGKILEDYDASCAEQAAAADEDDDAPAGADGPADAHSRNRAAHDEAPREGLPMAAAFKNWTANGPTQR
jgi:hypothetical protein